MIKKLGILLLMATGANAQDKGEFKSYSNPFYRTIVSESNTYDKAEKEKYRPTKEEITFAEDCLITSPFAPIYARVDIVYDNNNKPSLSELELIEPELWFRNYHKSAELLAKEIKKLPC